MSTHPMVTRAKAGIFKPLECMNCHVTTTSPLPRSHVHALRDPNWKEAMANVQKCNPCKTPVDTESKLCPDGEPVSDPTLYRSLAGALQYLTFTRPYLSYAVQQVCLYMHDPRDPHFIALKHILRYVCGTIDHGLQLHVSSTAQLTAYTDADWAGCSVTRRSTSGYCVFLVDNLLSWFAKQHVTLSRSSAEAEYRGVANVVAETAWLRNLLLELHAPLSTATIVYCDNVSAMYLSTNPVQHQRVKHIEIDIHFVRDYVASSQVRVLHVPSRYQYAHIFTKGLPSALFLEFCSSLKFDSKSYEGVFLGYPQTSKAYIMLNKETMRIEESLNVTFNESLPEPKSSSSIEDDRIDEPIVQDLNGSPSLQVNVSNEGYPKSLKEARGHPIEQAIGELNERTLRTKTKQA
ncbi:ribonuclease H-like domain-containing protein [Tanacetum coccineum]